MSPNEKDKYVELGWGRTHTMQHLRRHLLVYSDHKLKQINGNIWKPNQAKEEIFEEEEINVKGPRVQLR